MWDLIVSVPDHCLSFYYVYIVQYNVTLPLPGHGNHSCNEDLNRKLK